MVAGYLALIEIGKRLFYRTASTTPSTPEPSSRYRQLRRRAARFSTTTAAAVSTTAAEEH
jgi:Mg2+-importing ATPase